MTKTDFRLYADWNKDNDFSDSNEDITEYVISLTWRLGLSRPFQMVADEATLQAYLHNPAGIFNPENSSSPLYPNIKPQVPIKVTANGTVMWRGWLDFVDTKWQPGGRSHGELPVMLYALGAKQKLQDAEISLPNMENVTGDVIIARVLQDVVLPPAVMGGWLLGSVGYSELGITTYLADPSDYSDLETGVFVFASYGQDGESPDAYRIITEITEAERGKFFFNREGKAVWWNQNHVLDYSAPSATVDDAGVLGQKSNQVNYSYGKLITNRVQVRVAPRKADASPITLWTLDKNITILPSEIKYLECSYVDTDGLPVSAETGISITGETFSAGTATLSVEVEYSDRARIKIENTGTVNAILTAFDLEGTRISKRNAITIREEDLDSIQTYGKREQSINPAALDDPIDGQSLAQLEVLRFRDAFGLTDLVGFTRQANDVGNAHLLSWEIGDRIRIKLDPYYGHDQEYIIIGEQHSVTRGKNVHQGIFYVEPLVLKRLAYYGRANYDSGQPIEWSNDSPYTRQMIAQTFIPSATKTCKMVRMLIRAVGSPSGSLTAKIYSTQSLGGWTLDTSTLGVGTTLATTSAEPNTLLATSDSKDITTIDSGFKWVLFEFASPPTLTGGTSYALVLDYSGSSDPDNYYVWAIDGSSPTYSDGQLYGWDGTWWKPEDQETIFEVYGA